MTDPTTGRLAAALETPDESETAGRRLFLIIVWLSAGIGLFAQVTDSSTSVRIGAAVALLSALGVWLHVVHRVHTWRHEVSLRRVTIMLVGVYAILIGLLVVDSAHLILLFGVYSLTFGFVTELRLAAGLSLVVTMIWIGGWILHDLPTGALATPILVWATLVGISSIQDRVRSQSQERRSLLAEIHDTRTQLAETERQRGILAERQRVAAEIHDTLAQGFTSIVLLSQAIGSQAGALSEEVLRDKLGLVEQNARDNLVATRRLVQDLRPIELDTGSFVETITTVAQKHQASTGVAVNVVVTGTERAVGGTVDVALLRSIQEALANAAKHAHAEQITIELTYAPETIQACVVDDGVGFDPAEPAAEVAGVVGGQGLGLMAERAHALGGTAAVESTIGVGTTVRISLPIQESP